MTAIRGVLFDKDGTLFDFNATWCDWARRFLSDLAAGDELAASRLGAAIGFDWARTAFSPDSPAIAGTPRDIAERLLPSLPGISLAALVTRMNTAAAAAPMVEATPLVPLLSALRARGLRLGVVTNDAEAPARAHLAAVAAAPLLDYVAGFDSGFGAKPQPGALRVFAERFDIAPDAVAMVGDSRHDLVAARAAGMRAVAVLTGPAAERDLAPLAEVVLPDIGHLPAWIAGVTPEDSAA